MTRTTVESRQFPPGAMKVSDKLSDAIAYLYTDANGRPCMRVFYGKQSKPVARYWYRTDTARELAVKEYFEARRPYWAAKAKRKTFENPYKVGDIFKAAWGYDQTNVNY